MTANYNSNINFCTGLGVVKTGHVYGSIIGILNEYTPEEAYVIGWTDDTASVVYRHEADPRKQRMSDFRLIANDSRDFYICQQGDGYCSWCLDFDAVEKSDYRLAPFDSGIECCNCSIHAGESYHQRRKAEASKLVEDFANQADPFRIKEIAESTETLLSLQKGCPRAFSEAIDLSSVAYVLDELQGNIDKVRDMVADLCVIEGC